jgi:hypothetical protein
MKTESDHSRLESLEGDRIAAQFYRLTRRVAVGFKHQLEIARASGDKDAVIKEQIKLEVLKAARGMFSGSFSVALKRKPKGAWNEL